VTLDWQQIASACVALLAVGYFAGYTIGKRVTFIATALRASQPHTRRTIPMTKSESTVQHPIQPMYTDEKGVRRFKSNKIVCFLLAEGGFDMNKLATLPFSDEDRCQFAQLLGYSRGGFAELPYVSDKEWKRVEEVYP